MKSIEESLRHCDPCGRHTTHQRNTTSFPWVAYIGILVLALVIGFFTFGFGFIVLALIWLAIIVLHLSIHVLFKPLAGKWTCATCGTVAGRPKPTPLIPPSPPAKLQTPPPAPPRIPTRPALAPAPPRIPTRPALAPAPSPASHQGTAYRDTNDTNDTCRNPACGRLLPRAIAVCHHCGTPR